MSLLNFLIVNTPVGIFQFIGIAVVYSACGLHSCCKLKKKNNTDGNGNCCCRM